MTLKCENTSQLINNCLASHAIMMKCQFCRVSILLYLSLLKLFCLL